MYLFISTVKEVGMLKLLPCFFYQKNRELMEIAFIDSVGKDSLFYVKRGGSNQSKESVELELQRGFVA